MRGDEYRNWSGDRRHPADFHQPTTVDELQELVRSASSVRVVGSGHSFNDGLMTDGVTISLDRLGRCGRTSTTTTKQATAWGGTRASRPDTGAARRGSGVPDARLARCAERGRRPVDRRPRHRSRAGPPERLRDRDGPRRRQRHAARAPRARRRTFPGRRRRARSVGVITKLTFQCVDAFNLRQGTHVESREWAEANLDALFDENQHVSFYAYPFTDRLHVHTWTHTDEGRSRLGAFRESLNEAKAAVVAATLGDAMAHWGLLPKMATPTMTLQTADPSRPALARGVQPQPVPPPPGARGRRSP